MSEHESLSDTLLRLRNLDAADHEQLEQLENLAYPDLGGAWPRGTIDGLLKSFPEGQVCIEDNGRIVAAALTVRVDYNRFSSPHRYRDLVSADLTIFDDPEGDALYGIDVMVDPEYRGYRLGRRLYDARKELCIDRNLRGILAGGRADQRLRRTRGSHDASGIHRARAASGARRCRTEFSACQ